MVLEQRVESKNHDRHKISYRGSESCGGDPVGNLVFQFLFSAPLDLDLIRHRDSAALFNSQFFGAAPLAPDSIHYCDPAALFKSRFFGAAPLAPHFIHYRDPAALFISRFFGAAPLEPDLIQCHELAPELACFSIIAHTR